MRSTNHCVSSGALGGPGGSRRSSSGSFGFFGGGGGGGFWIGSGAPEGGQGSSSARHQRKRSSIVSDERKLPQYEVACSMPQRTASSQTGGPAAAQLAGAVQGRSLPSAGAFQTSVSVRPSRVRSSVKPRAASPTWTTISSQVGPERVETTAHSPGRLRQVAAACSAADPATASRPAAIATRACRRFGRTTDRSIGDLRERFFAV